MNKYSEIRGFKIHQLLKSVPHTEVPDLETAKDTLRIKYNKLRDKQIKNEFTKGVIRGLYLALALLGDADYSEGDINE